MILFIVSILILFVGGYFYGKYCEKVFQPDDRVTPATSFADGVDSVEMKKWKNQLVELLNIAGTEPILGPIQGILSGPIVLITIPIRCVLAGATHDYSIGMMPMRNEDAQVPKAIRKYMRKTTNKVYNIIIWILMLLVGVVFVYTSGDLIVNDILYTDVDGGVIWIVYGITLIYYLLATLFPIDKIIGRIYPILDAILIVSVIDVLGGVFLDGGANLHSITERVLLSKHPLGQSFIPVFFITVACGILPGFHGSQITLISRTVKNGHEGRPVFYNTMIAEGLIATCWASGAMALFNKGTALDTNATLTVGIISKTFMDKISGLFAIIGVTVLPITSGDTAFRSLRLMIGEQFNISQRSVKDRILLSLLIYVLVIAILYFAKTNGDGFGLLWRYFGFINQLVAIFALMLITVYLYINKENYFITMIPRIFYAFIVSSYIAHADLGLSLDKRLGVDGYLASYIVGFIFIVLFTVFVVKRGKIGQTKSELIG